MEVTFIESPYSICLGLRSFIKDVLTKHYVHTYIHMSMYVRKPALIPSEPGLTFSSDQSPTANEGNPL